MEYKHIRMLSLFTTLLNIIIFLNFGIDATCFFILNFEKYFTEFFKLLENTFWDTKLKLCILENTFWNDI